MADIKVRNVSAELHKRLRFIALERDISLNALAILALEAIAAQGKAKEDGR